MLTPILNFIYFQTWPQIWTFSSGKQTSEFRMWQLFLGTSLTELETNIAVANRQAKLTTPPFTAAREACLVINQLSWPPSGSCWAQRAGSQGGLGGGRGGGGSRRTTRLLCSRPVPSKADKPSLAPPSSFIWAPTDCSMYKISTVVPQNVTTCREQRD